MLKNYCKKKALLPLITLNIALKQQNFSVGFKPYFSRLLRDLPVGPHHFQELLFFDYRLIHLTQLFFKFIS